MRFAFCIRVFSSLLFVHLKIYIVGTCDNWSNNKATVIFTECWEVIFFSLPFVIVFLLLMLVLLLLVLVLEMRMLIMNYTKKTCTCESCRCIHPIRLLFGFICLYFHVNQKRKLLIFIVNANAIPCEAISLKINSQNPWFLRKEIISYDTRDLIFLMASG